MTDSAQEVLKQALSLTESERILVAEGILSTLDPDVPPVTDAAWAAEIDRRARAVMAGEAKGTDWAVVRERLWERPK